jgi:GNAT superfamily N-acetyltransferase
MITIRVLKKTPESKLQWIGRFGHEDAPSEESVRLSAMCVRTQFPNPITPVAVASSSEHATWFLELVKGEIPIGCLFLDSDPSYAISLLCITEAERGLKYSTQLIDKAKSIAIENGHSVLRLHAVNPVVAEKVYAPQGFVSTGEGNWMKATLEDL